MPHDAFTAGVKPGGLTTSLEIRILLCYLIQNAKSPLTQKEVERALLREELVNYFEIITGLSNLQKQNLVAIENDVITLLPAGEEIANTLIGDVPHTVRQTALQSLQFTQQNAIKQKQHQVEIMPYKNGYTVHCAILEGDLEVFHLSVYVADHFSAMQVREQFIEQGAELYRQTMNTLTSKT